MKLILSNIYKRNHKAYLKGTKYIVNQGGTSSTKTWSLLQLIVSIALYSKKRLKIDVVGLSVPHLRDGILTDIPQVCKSFQFDFHNNYNKSDKTLDIGNSVINFLSFDKLGKAHGGRRDILYINEANHVVYPIAQQLMMRTRKTVFIDFNPTSKFWAHTELIESNPNTSILICSTYKDNPLLEQSIIDYIESKKGDNNFWRVYGLGEIGYSEGLVFSNFKSEEFDKESFAEYRHGVDWGFSQDPFAYIRVAIDRKHKKLYICDEIYQRELLNSGSAPMVLEHTQNDLVWCDSAEPKSVAEYRTYGINSRSVKKGQGSIESGIKFIQDHEVIIHPDCKHTIEEFQTYIWKQDKNGGFLPKPEDNNNHIIDALRYALERDMDSSRTTVNLSGRLI